LTGRFPFTNVYYDVTSMEIGSAYALQVCLLQIPAMVAFSAWYDPRSMGEVARSFSYVSFHQSPILVIPVRGAAH